MLVCLLKLREQMLMNISEALENSSSSTLQKVQLTARAVAGLTKRGDELSPNAQVHLDSPPWKQGSME